MKVRAADAQLLPKRSIYHQDSGEMIKDFLASDEVPGVTNCSTVSLPPNMLIHKHVHPSKYEIFLTVGGSGFFKVWAPGAADGDDPREVFGLKPGCAAPWDRKNRTRFALGRRAWTYLGVVAQEPNIAPKP